MESTKYVNRKLEFVEELVYNTDSHIFLTGKAGTGKTTFLKDLAAKTYKRLVIVAPTGVAAINAGGVTIHSFFQLPFGPLLPEMPQTFLGQSSNSFSTRSLASQFQKINRTKLKIMRSLDLLVIDEISMVRADVLDAIDTVLRRARRSEKPFGGVQLLMIGDVHQLAPIAKADEWELLAPFYESVYFFSSLVLKKTPYICVELEHIYRQHDEHFIGLLNQVRCNRLDAVAVETLNSRYQPGFDPDDTEGFITLTTHNYQADTINETQLAEIKNKPIVFNATVSGTFPESSYPTKERLELKIGAHVMFVKNDPSPEKRYFNGKIGVLVGFDKESGELAVRCDDDTFPVKEVEWQNFEYSLNPENNEIVENEIGSFKQVPLRLAWAITIHKSQGLTFDKVVIDAGRAFAHGQVYVALSRCTALEGLVLKTPIAPYALKSDHDVEGFVKTMPEKEPSTEKIEKLRHEYELRSMFDLIDFDDLYGNFGRLMKTIMGNDTLFERELIENLSDKRKRLREEMVEVALKFEKQIEALHADVQHCEQNDQLQQRLVKGVSYFAVKLNDIVENLFDLPLKTDNKAINSQLEEILKQLKENVLLKQSCLNACAEGFNVRKYQETKSVKLLDAEKAANASIAMKDKKTEYGNDPLLQALLNWRDEKSEETGLNKSGIAPVKSLKQIAKEQPVTLGALRRIEGMGKNRVNRYGIEIIDIVLRMTGQMSIEEAIEEPETPQLDTYSITKRMLDDSLTPEEIAEKRNYSVSTIYNHISSLIKQGRYDASGMVAVGKRTEIREYFECTRDPGLKAAKEVLGDSFSYDDIKIVRSELERERFFEIAENEEE
ncbi:MAG: helix-turn-helix domain-containing protein [Candidatus Limimorpha sp.]